ncbi:MAG: hypothetical protein VST68_02850 [Nitrospirota bacterium]|nr:hypothetical protein [Nitrospirota bacterium]
MSIAISEHAEIFHVPYGSPNNEGTPDGSYVDIKANPEWIFVLPSCIGWPEIQRLLRFINVPFTPLMSLAADQGFANTENPARPIALTSFVILCLADILSNSKPTITNLANFLKDHLSDEIQNIANRQKRKLYLQVRLEIQPTLFHHHHFEGWSLMVLIAASEQDERQARQTWIFGLQALEQATTHYPGPKGD